MAEAAHVAVVGAGVFGACAAYELLKAGRRVTLLERDPVGRHASGRNPGNLNPLLATPAPLRPLAMDSFRLHEALQRELRELGCQSYDVAAVKRVLVGLAEAERADLEGIAAQFQAADGFGARWLGERELRALEPRLSPAAHFGLLLEGNRSLDAAKFNAALVEAAVKRGASLRFETVTDIGIHSPGQYTLHTDKGQLECDALVLAGGPWTDDLKSWLGVDLGIAPVKGQMLRLKFTGRDLTHDFTHGLISLYRRRPGEIWVGVTQEHCGLDERPSDAARRTLLEGAMQILPALAGAEVIEQLAALRPARHNGLPLVGELPGHKNVFIANGGGNKGMLICTGVARAIADLIAKGSTDMPIDEFRP